MKLLRTLGVFDLIDGESTSESVAPQTPVLGPDNPLALITYLALVPGRRAERDALVDALWGNADPDRASETN